MSEQPESTFSLASTRARLRARPDSEFEIALNRLVLGLLVLAYLISASLMGVESAGRLMVGPILSLALYLAVATMLIVDLVIRNDTSPTRRVVGILCDTAIISYGLYIGGELTSLLYPLYLWAILGNGFRYGVNYLAVCAVVSVIGFTTVIAVTPYWHQNPHLAMGLLGALVVIPLYASTLIRKLYEAKRQAEEASRSKSMFLASISHELRTPLNAIIGMSELMNDTQLNEEQRDMTSTVRVSANALLSLINSLLDFSRLEAGQMPSSVTDIDLHMLLHDVRAMVTAQARAKGIKLNCYVSAGTPFALRGDLRHLQEVLVNLAGNAVKFTDTGSVNIAVTTVRQNSEKAVLRFEVIDTGIGIAPDAQSRIFESFTQADETIIDSHGGTGLGLTISKQLVELQGGTIGLISERGAGSTFWFEIPFELDRTDGAEIAPAASRVTILSRDVLLRQRLTDQLQRLSINARLVEDIAQLADHSGEDAERDPVIVDENILAENDGRMEWLAAPGHGAAPRGHILLRSNPQILPRNLIIERFAAATAPRPANSELLSALRFAARYRGQPRTQTTSIFNVTALSVLVGEDNRTNQKVIAKILQRAGHTVTLVDNGEEVLDALAEVSYDIVLLDVNMPVMNGIEATKLYRFASLGRPRVPIIALTADATPDMAIRCREAGMDECLTKPVDPALLISVIARMVGDSAGEAILSTSDEAPTVAKIDAHPRFRPGGRNVLDERVLKDLEELGGADFVRDLLSGFVEDADLTMTDLMTAWRTGDVIAFREQAHALRSSAANIGARGIFELCLTWREISRDQLLAEGESILSRIEAEFEAVRYAVSGRSEQRRTAQGD